MDLPRIDFAPPIYQCRRAEEPFVLDGNLEKDFWKKAPFTDLFADIEGADMKAPRFKTRAKMLWDDENLYFGAVLEGDEIWGHLTERDCVIFYDNDFEIFIDPDSDTHKYFEYEMNVLNTVWDLFLPKPYREGTKPLNGWDIHGLRSAVKVYGEVNNPVADNKCWSVEVVMPFAALSEMAAENRAPKAGEYYRVNFSRVQWDVDVVDGTYRKRTDANGNVLPENNWVWSPTGVINIHYPELWGFVFFTDKDEEYSIPAREYVSWELRKLYYFEHIYCDTHGTYTDDLDKLNLKVPCAVPVQIETTSHGFEVSAYCPEENLWVMIKDDGLVTLHTDEEWKNTLQERGSSTFVYTQKDEDGNLSGEVEVSTGLSDGDHRCG